MFSALTMDWVAGAALILLGAAWHWLYFRGGALILALAFSHQWVQATAGIYYHALTGRQVRTMLVSDYRPMVILATGGLAALLIGLVVGRRILFRRFPDRKYGTLNAFDWRSRTASQRIAVAYILAWLVQVAAQAIAWDYPRLTQAIIQFAHVRMLVLFLLLRILVHRQQWALFAAVLSGEVVVAFTSFFAIFREPIVLALLATMEGLNRRRMRDWCIVVGLGGVLVLSGLVWTGVKNEFRYILRSHASTMSTWTRMGIMCDLIMDWGTGGSEEILGDCDAMVDRIWDIRYQAAALNRVPRIVPHQDGELLENAVMHVLRPRILFPNKEVRDIESEAVRKFAGVRVAGRKQNVSIAFGYVAEAYVDFGVPLMFVPIFVFGLIMGMSYQWFSGIIRHDDLRIGFVTVAYWIILYGYGYSWLKLFGRGGMLMIVVGGIIIFADRYFLKARGAVRSVPNTGIRAPITNGSRNES